MVSADIHGMETPSPLTTPGYLTLLSEDSTPVTPATLHGTLHSTSPLPANSPRISFRSFTLPLDIENDETSTEKLNRNSVSSDKVSDTSHSLSITMDSQTNVMHCKNMQTYSRLIESYEVKSFELSATQLMTHQSNDIVSEFFDQEMTPCDRLVSSSSDSTISGDLASLSREQLYDGLSPCLAKESRDIDSRNLSEKNKFSEKNSSSNENAVVSTSYAQENKFAGLSLSSMTNLDIPMSCEQTFEDLPDFDFVICNRSDNTFTTTDTESSPTNANNAGEWVMVECTTGLITTPTSENRRTNDSSEGTVNPAIATEAPQLRSTSENILKTSLDLTMGSNINTDASCIATSDLTESPILTQELSKMHKEFKTSISNHDQSTQRISASFITNSPRRLRMQKFDMDQSEKEESRKMDQEVFKMDKETCKVDQDFNQTTKIQEKKSRSSESRQNQKRYSIQENFPRVPERYKPLLSSDGERKNVSQLQEAFEKNIEKCHGFGHSQQKQRNFNYYQYRMKHLSDTSKRNLVQNTRIPNNEMIIPSENAAEPYEDVRAPEGASETASLTSSCTFSNVSSPIEDSLVLRDTAAILQELALQRLSGGVGEVPVSSRRCYNSEMTKDKKSFDSEIGREIVRERKMMQELDYAREKYEESSVGVQHLPPCLRARHARATRAALSRSLDEGKFNQMTGESSLSKTQTYEDSQHSSTPNVGTESILSTNNSDRIYVKNLGGLDLGDPRCRERIEKYKEERRMFLRDKYRSESFRASKAEDEGEQALLARLKQRASRPSFH